MCPPLGGFPLSQPLGSGPWVAPHGMGSSEFNSVPWYRGSPYGVIFESSVTEGGNSAKTRT